MTSQWNEITEIFSTLVELEPSLRLQQLISLKQTHPEIAAQVELLLKGNDDAEDSFLAESPVAKIFATGHMGSARPEPLAVGQVQDGFEILALLGEGSFANVYLAREIALNRMIALKVSQLRGFEARTMASLEHDHIVTVFSERIYHEKSVRFICMQYIAGVTLRKALEALSPQDRLQKFTETILTAIDKGVTHPTAFSASLARDRQMFENFSKEDAVAWLGGRLALAIDHAHTHGVLHLDIKPENILLSQSGKPYLVDFNVSSVSTPNKETPDEEEAVYGGTLMYMSPEQREAFLTKSRVGFSKLGAKSDVFSLGLVLRELYTGDVDKSPDHQHLDQTLLHIIDKAACTSLDQRFSSAKDFAEALSGYHEFSRIGASMPKSGLITKFCRKYPLMSLTLLILVPQSIGAIFNIIYNDLRVLGPYSSEQKTVFREVIFLWNPLVFTLTFAVMFLFYWPLRTDFLSSTTSSLSLKALNELRLRALRLPNILILLTSIGWGTAFTLFAFVNHNYVTPLSGGSLLHLFVSFFMAWIVGLTYSYLFAKFVMIRIFYVRLLAYTKDAKRIAKNELAKTMTRITFFHVLAGVIPLLAATLLLGVSPADAMAAEYGFFRILLFILIAAGSIGFLIALRVSMYLQNVIFAIKGQKESM